MQKRYILLLLPALLLLLAPLAAHAQIAAGGYHSCAILKDTRLKCWGNNSVGHLGLGDTQRRGEMPSQMGNNLPAVDLGTGRTAAAIAGGNGHSCAILENGSVKCWGFNHRGQLGLGDTSNRGDAPGQMGDNLPTVDLGTGRTATAIATKTDHTCALLDDGSIKCWGIGSLLGLGDKTNRGDVPGQMGDNLPAVNLGTGRTAVAIAAGDAHSCAILENGSIKCWGRNNLGQLGLGDQTNRGDKPGQMGNNLPAADLGVGRTAVAITAGYSYTCALLKDGSIKCWGHNNRGQLGLGDKTNRGDAPGQMGDNLPAVNLGTGRTAVAIAAGGSHTCAILDDGSVKCWGNNSSGELGLGDTNNRGDKAGQMGDNLPTVDLGTGRTAVAIAAGYLHTCAILDNRTVKCWGTNFYAQLGLGHLFYRGYRSGEMGDDLPPVDLGGDALPVELVSFTATLDGTSARLRWTTASETNNAGFDVEHRSGTGTFRNAGFVAGHGTTAETNSYDFSVEGLQPGRHVFRLRQIDFDGAFEYSAEVELTLDAAGASLALFGNPAREQIRGVLTLPSSQQQARVVLFDMLGRRVLTQEAVEGAFSLDVGALPAGAYVLRAEAGPYAIRQSVVIAR